MTGLHGRQRLPRHPLDGVDRIAERVAGREVEGEGHRRQLPEVVHGERADVLRERRDGVERDEWAAGRAHVEPRRRRPVALPSAIGEDDLVLVGGRVDGRDPLPWGPGEEVEGVVVGRPTAGAVVIRPRAVELAVGSVLHSQLSHR